MAVCWGHKSGGENGESNLSRSVRTEWNKVLTSEFLIDQKVQCDWCRARTTFRSFSLLRNYSFRIEAVKSKGLHSSLSDQNQLVKNKHLW